MHEYESKSSADHVLSCTSAPGLIGFTLLAALLGLSAWFVAGPAFVLRQLFGLAVDLLTSSNP